MSNYYPPSPSAADVAPGSPDGPSSPGTEPLAILGLVFAFLFWPLGLVLSVLGITRTGEGKRKGRGLAVAGVVVSCIGAFFLALLVVIAVTAEPNGEPAAALADTAPVAAAPVDDQQEEAAAEQAAAEEAAAEEAAAEELAIQEAAAAEEAAAAQAAADAEKAAAEAAAAKAAADEAAAAEAAAQGAFGPQPAQQKDFVAHVTKAQAGWSDADNDLQRGALKAERDTRICETVPGLKVSGWTGIITTIDANGDGKGVIGIEIAEDVHVKTWNNAFSDIMDETLIDPASPVFAAALEKSEGDVVTFSGEFVEETDGACVRESSLTLGGAVQDPEFIFRFSDLS